MSREPTTAADRSFICNKAQWCSESTPPLPPVLANDCVKHAVDTHAPYIHVTCIHVTYIYVTYIYVACIYVTCIYVTCILFPITCTWGKILYEWEGKRMGAGVAATPAVCHGAGGA